MLATSSASRKVLSSCAVVAALLLTACRGTPSGAPPALAPSCGSCDGTTITTAPVAPLATPAETTAPDVADLVARVKPAVVNITTLQEVKVRRPSWLPDWPFGDPFGGLFPGPGRAPDDDEARMNRRALGSGFVVEGGYVVTNAHVVENADRVRVRLADERELDAKVKGRDTRLDLAVLELEGGKDLPAVTLGSSDELRVGEHVIAIGNPFGLGHTVTMGIVSAKSRAIGAGPYDDFIQTDASINPGNSGGPLFDTRGRVVGVNTAINPAGRGIGFAIPVDALKEVLPQLVEKGTVSRGRLGVRIQNVDEPLAKALGMDRPRGALVAEVEAKSAGEKAGLRAGDVIVSLDGKDVPHSNDLPRMVARHAPGTRVNVGVLRDGKQTTIPVTLDELAPTEGERAGASSGSSPNASGPAAFGVTVADRQGKVVVTHVAPGSAAEGVLRPGDVVLEVDRRRVANAAEASRTLASRARGHVLLRIERDGVVRYAALGGEPTP